MLFLVSRNVLQLKTGRKHIGSIQHRTEMSNLIIFPQKKAEITRIPKIYKDSAFGKTSLEKTAYRVSRRSKRLIR